MTTPTCIDGLPIPCDPMCWRRAFPGRAEQAAAVRRFVSCLLTGSPYADDAVHVVAELTANAICHSRSGEPGGLLVVQVRRWRGGGSIAVTDQGGPTEPHLGDPDPYAGHGLGLRLVAATATWWGWRGDATGRTVTAIFTCIGRRAVQPPG